MGTRSTIKFKDNFAPHGIILCVYQQFDGYISGVGHDLAKWLQGKRLINGINTQTMEEGYANGMGCLAAQFIAEHKTKIGNLYCTTKDDIQEYNYIVSHSDTEGFIIEERTTKFRGTPQELLEFAEV